jgi:hypothetical protein
MKRVIHWLVIGFLLCLTACVAWNQTIATATPPPPTGTLLPTAIILWFPPSATPARIQIVTPPPTAEELPSVGKTIATDIFDSPDAWDTAISDQGSATVNRNRLTLAIQPQVYMLSLNKDLVLGDFYAEITARPSLCKGQDDYGLLFRASAVAYYRYALSCDGTVRLERVSVGEHSPLFPRTPSGDAPPGAPSEVRIGVWAVGTEMRFFLNGRYQFTVVDANLASGTLGVFARSSGDTAVTVAFSDLVVHTVAFASPTPSPMPSSTPKPMRTPLSTP